MITNLSELIKNDGEDTHICRGLIFKCSDTEYKTKRGYARKQEMKFLSRSSCHECCISSLLDELNEFGAIFPDKLTHDGLYYLTTTNHRMDWETGYIDSYDLIFHEVVE